MPSVFLVPYGGLGNQLFQYTAALSLHKNSPVTILSQWGFAKRNVDNDLELQSFVVNHRVSFSENPKIGALSKRLLNLLLRLGAENRSWTLTYLEWVLSPYFSYILKEWARIQVNRGLGLSNIRTNGSVLLIGYFQSSNYLINVKSDVLKIRPVKMTKEAEKLVREIQEKRTLVIHIRRGDYLNQPFGILQNSYYSEALKKIGIENFDEFWIFSDDITQASQLSVFKGMQNVRFVSDRQLSSAEVLEIMRHGSGFIIANSSFSWWAAQLRSKPEARVICPSPWFKEIDSPKGIIDSDWTHVQW
jgi:hypothetical protein